MGVSPDVSNEDGLTALHQVGFSLQRLFIHLFNQYLPRLINTVTNLGTGTRLLYEKLCLFLSY